MTRIPADGTHGQADRYLGDCNGCPARVNYGDNWVIRAGKRFHEGCDPTPDPIICGWCHTEVVLEPGNVNRFPCHDGDCYRLYMSFFVWFPKGLAEYLSPEPTPKGLRPDASTAVRFGPRGARDVRLAQRQAAWRDLG